MPRVTIVFALLLIAQGLYAYLGAADENPSKTALIPAVVGVLLCACGIVALLYESLRKHLMHAAAAIALLGALAAGSRTIMKVSVLFSSDPEVNRRPVLMTLTMTVICLVFFALCVQSFVAARQRQAAGGGRTEA